MRQILLFLSLFVTAQAFGQFVIGNSPASIEGSYAFGTGDWGPAVIDSIWTGDLKIIDDGSAEPTIGCEPVMEADQLAGFIAVVDRATCNFSLKTFHAQEAGAIAVIIINNNPLEGVINMAGGDRAADGVIPSVFLSFEDGEILKAAMADGPVNMTIGNVKFGNNIGANLTEIISPLIGIVPESELSAEGIYTLAPGALITNNGLNPATNVNIAASIDWTPDGGTRSNVYSEVATIPFIEVDSSEGALAPEIDFFGSGLGTYNIDYTFSSDSIDEVTFDNAASTSFSISENTFSKAGWNATTGRANVTTGFTVAGGGNIEFLSPFRINNSVGKMVSQIGFDVTTNAPSFAGITVGAYLYRFEDFDDNNAIDPGELILLALEDHEFPADDSTTNAYLTLDLINLTTFDFGYEIQPDDEVLIAGVRYEGAETVFFGFDQDMDYTQAINAPGIGDPDLPYIFATTFTNAVPDVESFGLFADTRFAVATEMLLTGTVSTKQLTEDAISLQTFPNPASDNLTISYNTNERFTNSVLRIFDTAGKTVLSERVNFDGIGTMDINVSNYAPGTYIMSFKSEEGILTKSFNVTR